MVAQLLQWPKTNNFSSNRISDRSVKREMCSPFPAFHFFWFGYNDLFLGSSISLKTNYVSFFCLDWIICLTTVLLSYFWLIWGDSELPSDHCRRRVMFFFSKGVWGSLITKKRKATQRSQITPEDKRMGVPWVWVQMSLCLSDSIRFAFLTLVVCFYPYSQCLVKMRITR